MTTITTPTGISATLLRYTDDAEMFDFTVKYFSYSPADGSVVNQELPFFVIANSTEDGTGKALMQLQESVGVKPMRLCALASWASSKSRRIIKVWTYMKHGATRSSTCILLPSALNLISSHFWLIYCLLFQVNTPIFRAE